MIVGIAGRSGVGKDYVADKLCDLYDGPSVKASFADIGKKSVAALFGLSLEDIEKFKRNDHMRVVLQAGPHNTHCSMTFRQFLQRFFTEAHRDIFGQKFWTDYMRFFEDGLTVVPDVRFENEAERIKEDGGWVIEVIRPLADEAEVINLHVSEVGLPRHFVDFTVVNWNPDSPVDEQLSTLMTVMADMEEEFV